MRADQIINGLLEELANIEHERWAHWQTYIHSKGVRQSDGSLLIPAELVEQWNRQIATPYAMLSEVEKEATESRY